VAQNAKVLARDHKTSFRFLSKCQLAILAGFGHGSTARIVGGLSEARTHRGRLPLSFVNAHFWLGGRRGHSSRDWRFIWLSVETKSFFELAVVPESPHCGKAEPQTSPSSRPLGCIYLEAYLTKLR
jgi:hypothetical protein